MSLNKRIGVASLSLALIAAASLCSGRALDFFHEVTNLFAGGRNPVRLYLFIAYALSLLGLLAWSKRRTTAATNNKALKAWTVAIIMVAFILNIFQFFAFASQYGMPSDQYLISGNGGEITTNRLIHNHMGKASLAFLVKPFAARLENADPGIALIGLTNPIGDAAYGLLCVAVLVFMYLVFWRQAATRKRPALYWLAYAIFTFTLVKSLVDGGIFAETALVAFAAYIALIQESAAARIKTIIGGIAFTALAHGALFYGGYYTNASELLTHAYKGFAFALGAISLLIWICVEQRRRLAVLVSLLAGIALASLLYDAVRASYDYRSIAFAPGEAIFGTYKGAPDGEGIKLFGIGDLGFYKITESGSVGGLIDAEPGLIESFYPTAVAWKTCLPTAHRLATKFTVSTPDALSAAAYENGYLSWKAIATTTQKEGWHTYNVTLTTDPCLTREINIIDEILRAQGADTYMLSNLEFND